MTIRLAGDGPRTLHADTIGAAWLAVAGRILAEGIASRYDGLPVREISLVTLTVDRPDPRDEIIARHAEPERLAWMHANFTDHARVAALGGADSYPPGPGAWVSPLARTRPPGPRHHHLPAAHRHQYIPCVSLLDFWLPDGAVELSPTRTASTSAPRATATWSNSPPCSGTWPASSAARPGGC